MIVPLYWLTLWLYAGLALLQRWRGKVGLRDVSVALPLGLVLTTLGTLLLWLGGITLPLIARYSEILLILVMVYFFSLRWPLTLAPQVLGRRLYQKIRLTIGQPSIWPLAWLMGVMIFSLAIVISWQTLVEPVTWDNLTLYDFRAQRLARGWLPTDFFAQFNDQASWSMYDFLHPMLSSISSAFIYQRGGVHAPVISAVLLLCVVVETVKTWRSREARIIFGALTLSSPLFFNAAVEGYGAWSATLFWALFFLFTWRHSLGQRWEQIVAGFLLAAAVQSRLSEPYWLVAVMWLLMRRRWITILPAALSFVNWQVVVHIAAQHTTSQVVRSTYTTSWLETLFTNLSPNLILVLVVDGLLKNPLLPYWLVVMSLAIWLGRVGVWSARLREYFLLLLSWSFILLGGMTALWARNPTIWPEMELALPRAVLPLAVLCAIFTAASIEQLVRSRSAS